MDHFHHVVRRPVHVSDRLIGCRVPVSFRVHTSSMQKGQPKLSRFISYGRPAGASSLKPRDLGIGRHELSYRLNDEFGRVIIEITQ